MLDPRPAEGAEVEVVEEARHVEPSASAWALRVARSKRGSLNRRRCIGQNWPWAPAARAASAAARRRRSRGGQAAEHDPEVVAVVLEQVLEDLGGARAGRAGVVGVDDDRDERLGAALKVVIGGERDLVAPLGHRRGLGAYWRRRGCPRGALWGLRSLSGRARAGWRPKLWIACLTVSNRGPAHRTCRRMAPAPLRDGVCGLTARATARSHYARAARGGGGIGLVCANAGSGRRAPAGRGARSRGARARRCGR
jgi:hypothetical protein